MNAEKPFRSLNVFGGSGKLEGKPAWASLYHDPHKTQVVALQTLLNVLFSLPDYALLKWTRDETDFQAQHKEYSWRAISMPELALCHKTAIRISGLF